jgi:type III pantothenate kinase
MLLAIDIGNTNITLGVFRKKTLIKKYCFPTKGNKILAHLKKISALHKIDRAIIAGVVPNAQSLLEKKLKQLNIKTLIAGRDIIVPVKNLYQYPKQVGQDRLVNAFAAIQLYGYPAVVVDFGTAITFDIISKNKEYLGGMILPGLLISLEALHEKTALLPNVKLKKPKNLIGRNTKESILSGIVYGFSNLSDSLIRQLKANLGNNTKAIGTGGNIRFIGRLSKEFDKLDQDLTLKGINLLSQSIL